MSQRSGPTSVQFRYVEAPPQAQYANIVLSTGNLKVWALLHISSAVATNELFSQFQPELQVSSARSEQWQVWRQPLHYKHIAG